MKTALDRLLTRINVSEAYSRKDYDELARVEGNRLDRVPYAHWHGGTQTPMRQLSDNYNYGQGPFVKRFT